MIARIGAALVVSGFLLSGCARAQTTGEIRIELGTDNPFESTDDFYTAFFRDGYEGTIDAKFPQASFTGTFYVSGGEVLSVGDVDVTCG